MRAPLEKLVAIFQRHLYLPDRGPLLVTLGTIAANRMDGDPVWTLMVGSAGSLKSELLQPVARLCDVHPVGTISEAGLLSGTGQTDRAPDATGGLLCEMGKFGIILCKDFTSILNMHREKRQAVLAALREVYDGSWTRVLGTDGGRVLRWEGKVGFIGGVTPTIDRHQAVMATMGERFVLYRMPEVDDDRQARAALAHAGLGSRMRLDLLNAVQDFFQGLDLTETPLTSEEENYLILLARLVVRCRSAVERDSYTREIELIPPPEAPTRIVIVLDRFYAGLRAIGVDPQEAWRIIRKVGFDCMPVGRRILLERMAKQPHAGMKTHDLSEATRYPLTTVRRHLEELRVHGIVERTSGGNGNPDAWRLSDWTRSTLEALESVPGLSDGKASVPEMSGGAAEPSVPEKSEASPTKTVPEVSGAPSSHSSREEEDITGTATGGGPTGSSMSPAMHINWKKPK